jgi:hypothetical protein
VKNLISVLGPMVASALAKQNVQGKIDPDSLHESLQKDWAEFEKHGSGLEEMFDQDNDGDVDFSDIASLVMKKMEST